MPEAGGVSVGQFLLDGLEILPNIGELLLLTAGEGHPAYQPALPGQLLLAEVVAVKVALVLARPGGTAQAEAVLLCLRDESVDAVIFREFTPVAPAVGTHGGQVLQWAALPHGVHKFLQGLLELRGVEAVAVVGPPGVVEALPAGTKIHAEMAHGAQLRILILSGVEKARLLNGSGPQVKVPRLFDGVLLFHLNHLIPVL